MQWAIVRLKLHGNELDDPGISSRWKLTVVLSVDCSDSCILTSLFTSKVERFAGGRFDREILRVAGGDYDFLPLDSVLSFAEPKDIDRASLLRRFLDGDLSFEGQLRSAHAKEVESKIRCSTRIVRGHKKRIVPGFG